MDIEELISEIENADEVEIMEFDFSPIFTALRDLKSSIAPFSNIAERWLSVDGRLIEDHYRDDDPVCGCNNVVVTIGDCKRILEVING